MRERRERVESPGTYVIEWALVHFALPCVLSDRPPMLWWLSHGEERDAVTWCGWDKVKRAQLLKIKAQLSSIWAKGCILMTICVFYLTWHEYPSLVEGESHGILLWDNFNDCEKTVKKKIVTDLKCISHFTVHLENILRINSVCCQQFFPYLQH